MLSYKIMKQNKNVYEKLYSTKNLVLLVVALVFQGQVLSQIQEQSAPRGERISVYVNNLEQLYPILDKATNIQSLVLISDQVHKTNTVQIVSKMIQQNDIFDNIFEFMVHVNELRIDDVKSLSKYASLKEISFVDTEFENLAFLPGLNNIKEVAFCSAYISDFKDISNCTQIRDLCIISCRGFRSLSPVLALRKLKSLEIVDVNLVLTDKFPNLNRLEDLYLGGNQLEDIKNLSGFTNLKTLTLCDNNIEDISVLSNLKQLKELTLSGNNISDISPLSSLIALEKLDLSGNKIEDITPVYNLKSIKNLILDRNMIRDIAPLKNCSEIELLSLSGNKIEDISILNNLAKLEILDMSNNKIKYCDALRSLKKMYSFSADQNIIEDIAFITDLKNLRSLSLSNNNISNITPLSSLENLEYLNLNSNNITDFSVLKRLKRPLTVFVDDDTDSHTTDITQEN